ncbi:het-c2 protein [Paxillus ammoniavirescens]|nr:het-c2 protein [Paxillus ammoniavirescens]
MAPFLQTVKSFADVPITDAGVDTLDFLAAAEGVVCLFKLLDNPAFALVVSDLEGNITKVRTRYDSHPTQSTTLELLIRNEQSDKKRPATEGLMWLLRGLSFTHKALHAAQSDPNAELAAAFTTGYDGSLKKYHNFVVKGVFALAMKACPQRAGFYTKLAADPDGGAAVPQDKLNEELNAWLEGLDKIVKRMQKVYKENGYGEV